MSEGAVKKKRIFKIRVPLFHPADVAQAKAKTDRTRCCRRLPLLPLDRTFLAVELHFLYLCSAKLSASQLEA